MKALIADNDPEAIEHISQAFDMYFPDSELLTTDSGRECLDMVREKCPDIVILGLNLADVPSFDVIEQIRCCSEALVIVTSYIDDGNKAAKAFTAGADGYMTKSIRRNELAARVKALIRRSKLTSPSEIKGAK
jgi:DNA-binding response OmpR family regulator